MSVVHVSEQHFKGVGGEIGSITELKSDLAAAMGDPIYLDAILGKTITADLLSSYEFKQYLQDMSYRKVIETFVFNSMLDGNMSAYKYSEILKDIATFENRERLAVSLMFVSLVHADEVGLVDKLPIQED